MTTTIALLWRRGDAYPENWPQWLREADIEWCRVEISEDGRVVWYDGVWNDGYWRGGTWHDGYWRGGTWYGGLWYGGLWRDGVWHDDGTWRTDGPPRSG